MFPICSLWCPCYLCVKKLFGGYLIGEHPGYLQFSRPLVKIVSNPDECSLCNCYLCPAIFLFQWNLGVICEEQPILGSLSKCQFWETRDIWQVFRDTDNIHDLLEFLEEPRFLFLCTSSQYFQIIPGISSIKWSRELREKPGDEMSWTIRPILWFQWHSSASGLLTIFTNFVKIVSNPDEFSLFDC